MYLEITTQATPQAKFFSEETVLASTHLSILIYACFRLNVSAHNIFAFPNIHIDFRVPVPVFNKILGKKNESKHLKHPILIYFLWTNICSWSQSWIQTDCSRGWLFAAGFNI